MPVLTRRPRRVPASQRHCLAAVRRSPTPASACGAPSCRRPRTSCRYSHPRPPPEAARGRCFLSLRRARSQGRPLSSSRRRRPMRRTTPHWQPLECLAGGSSPPPSHPSRLFPSTSSFWQGRARRACASLCRYGCACVREASVKGHSGLWRASLPRAQDHKRPKGVAGAAVCPEHTRTVRILGLARRENRKASAAPHLELRRFVASSLRRSGCRR